MENIRNIAGIDDAELRQSLERFGWHKELPALIDEYGATLVGNRRFKIAKELGIDPVTRTIVFGAGDASDVERVKLALVSNLGGKSMTREDRKRLAERLYGNGWTMQNIAVALGVSQRQISTDLQGLEVTSKPPRPKGGRPKAPSRPKLQDAKDKILAYEATTGKLPPANRHFREIPDITPSTYDRAVREIEGARASSGAPLKFTKAQDVHVAARIKMLAKELEADFNERVRLGILERNKEYLAGLEELEKKARDQQELYEMMVNRHQPIFTEAEFNDLTFCAHWDQRKALTQARADRAFVALNAKKLQLTGKR